MINSGKVKVLVAQLCLALCDPMDYSPLGSSVHGLLQAGILKWGAISSSRGSSQPREWTRVSWIVGRFFTIWATREAQTQGILCIWSIYIHYNHYFLAQTVPFWPTWIFYFRDFWHDSSSFSRSIYSPAILSLTLVVSDSIFVHWHKISSLIFDLYLITDCFE